MAMTDDDLGAFFGSLEQPLETVSAVQIPAPTLPEAKLAKAARPPKTHDCLECGGTGVWKGVRIHQPESKCFACKGKGWFRQSYADRMKGRANAANRKQKALETKQAAFREAHEGLIEALQAIAGWHQFAATMIAAYQKWGGLTEKQVEASRASLLRVEAKRAERAKQNETKTGDVDVGVIETMFKTAVAAGLKSPRFRTERLMISLAPAHGRNAGALYVKCDGTYSGKIVGGKFTPAYQAPAEILGMVREIAASPIEAARAYGKRTGSCSCCGRELTDPASIEAGIGPICEEKWNL